MNRTINPEKAKPILYIVFMSVLILSLFPVPYPYAWWLPEGCLLVILFWIFKGARQLSLLIIFLFGVMYDLLHGGTLGLHSFTYIFVASIAYSIRLRFCFYPTWQQVFIVSLLVFIHTLLIVSCQFFLLRNAISWEYWGTVVTTSCLWLLVPLFVRKYPWLSFQPS